MPVGFCTNRGSDHGFHGRRRDAVDGGGQPENWVRFVARCRVGFGPFDGMELGSFRRPVSGRFRSV